MEMQLVPLVSLVSLVSLLPVRQYDYSFRTEHSAAARLPPSPTRTSLSSEA